MNPNELEHFIESGRHGRFCGALTVPWTRVHALLLLSNDPLI